MGTRSELVGEKRGGGECDYMGLGLRDMQESGHKRVMVVPPHHGSQLLSCFRENTITSSDDGGPMFCNTSNEVACVGDIYDVVAAAGSDANSAVMVPKSTSSSDPLFPFNYSASQLQELERQNTIYKYITASVPIPHQLLFPCIKAPSSAPPSHSNNPEPWRCRRTDGKKWRCSRDVAPDQKYCERHSHKSRPRSRKPVELPPHTINNNNPSLTRSLNLASNTNYKPYPKSYPLNQTMVPVATSCEQQSSCLDWLNRGDMNPVTNNSNQQWHQMMQSNVEPNKDSTECSGYYGENLIDTSSKMNLGGGGVDGLAPQARRLHDHNSSLLGTKLLSHQAETQESNLNTNAWSIPPQSYGESRCFISPDDKESLYSLMLSMSGESGTIERNEDVVMGFMGGEKGDVGNLKPHWMNHVSHSQPGGPLAEALCLGIARSDSNVGESPHGYSTSTTDGSKSSHEDGGQLQQGFNFIN